MSLGNVLSNYSADYNRYAGYARAAVKPDRAQKGDFFGSHLYAKEEAADKDGLEQACRRPAADEQKLIDEFSEEEWEALLAKTDAQIEAMQASVEEEIAEAAEQVRDTEVRCTGITSRNQWDDPDTKQTEYSGTNGLTVYTRGGIFYLESSCDTKGKSYTDRVEWSIKFDSEDDYERTMEWLSCFPESDSKRFATSEEFWKDFLSGELDEDGFMAYYGETDHGAPRVLVSDEDGNTRIDEEVIRSPFFRYFNIGKVMTPISKEEVIQRFHSQVSAELRGEKYQPAPGGKSRQETIQEIQKTVRELFADADERSWQFAGEACYGLQEWISELLERARGGLMEELQQKKSNTAVFRTNIL